MSRWFRVYDDLVDDPKIQRLPGETVKSLLNLWCLASQNSGMLPASDDIAFKLRMKPAQVQKLLSVLGECGLIDSDENGLRPHNWSGRQFKSDTVDETAAERMRRYRALRRNNRNNRNNERNGDAPVTVPRAETEQITEQKESCPDAKAPRTKSEYSEDFEANFWVPYPRSPTMAKKEAWREWMKLAPEQRAAACQAIEPYKKYLRSKPNLETVHACRFLSQQRFDGFINGAAAGTAKLDIRGSLV